MEKPKKTDVENLKKEFNNQLHTISVHERRGTLANSNIYFGTAYELPKIKKKAESYAETCDNFVETKRKTLNNLVSLLTWLEKDAE